MLQTMLRVIIFSHVVKSKHSGQLTYKGLLVYVAWGRGQLRINFTTIFKVFTKLPESRRDEGNLENFENTSKINR